MINMKSKKIVRYILLLGAASASASHGVVIGGVDYNSNISFPGVSTSVFTSPQSFALSGLLTGWSVSITGQFSDSNYLSAPTYAPTISTTNSSGAAFQNPTFPGANGIHFSELPDTYGGNNLTVSFSFEFIRTSGLSYLPLAVYSAESSDLEIDTLSNTGGVFANFSTANLSSSSGSGTSTAIFDSVGNPSGIGQWITTTSVNSGDVITWTYDFNLTTDKGNNMIGFSSVPEPSVALLGVLAGAAGFARRRRA